MGGVAIILILLVVVALVALGFFLSGTGAFLWKRKTDPAEDKIEGATGTEAAADADRRPRHTRPTDPAQENTDFVGSPPSGVPERS